MLTLSFWIKLILQCFCYIGAVCGFFYLIVVFCKMCISKFSLKKDTNNNISVISIQVTIAVFFVSSVLSYSDIFVAIPPVMDLKAVPTSMNSIRLSWRHSQFDSYFVDGFIVQRVERDGTRTVIAKIYKEEFDKENNSALFFTDDNTTIAREDNSYHIFYFRKGFTRIIDGSSTKTTAKGALQAVESLVSTSDGNFIHLSWNPVDGATSYEIYRMIGADGDFTYLAESTGTEYIDFNPANGEYNYYWVCPVKATDSEHLLGDTGDYTYSMP